MAGVQKEEKVKEGKSSDFVRFYFDEKSRKFLGIKYNPRPNGSINYRDYKVIKKYKYQVFILNNAKI